MQMDIVLLTATLQPNVDDWNIQNAKQCVGYVFDSIPSGHPARFFKQPPHILIMSMLILIKVDLELTLRI